jgi:quercetin dioxygenase-like cupin family protein
MSILRAPARPTHELPHARFRSLATPSKGSRETSVWRVELTSDSPGARHSLTREEIFVVLSGTVQVILDGESADAHPGDAIVIPKDTEFAISCVGGHADVLCILPVGGQARFPNGPLFTPPWAQ